MRQKYVEKEEQFNVFNVLRKQICRRDKEKDKKKFFHMNCKALKIKPHSKTKGKVEAARKGAGLYFVSLIKKRRIVK